MSRFDSLDRLLTHDDNFRELLTILSSDTSRHDHLNGTSAANMPFAGGGDDDVAGAAGSDMLDGGRGNDMIWGGSSNANWATSHNSLLPVNFDKKDSSGNTATTVYGAGVGDEQNDHFSLLHMIESMHGLPPLGQSASAPLTSFASTRGESGSSTGETHVASPPTVPDPPPVTDPAPADPTPATPNTSSADFATSNLDAGHWALKSTWSGILVNGKDFTQSITNPNSASTRRNMRQWPDVWLVLIQRDPIHAPHKQAKEPDLPCPRPV
jgi:hypothetical protein